MNFDRWWDWDDEGVKPFGGGHLQKLPNGRHTGDIVEAEIEDKKFKVTDTNPTGTCLVVTWSKQGYHPVESICPVNWRGLIEAICRAAGVSPPQRGENWNEKQLVGRVATIDVENAVAASGKEYQRVTKWHASPQTPLPASEKPPPAKRPARTATAKAHEEFTTNAPDDIPF